MSVSAVKLDEWYIDEPDCQVETRANEVDGVSTLQWRDHFTIKMSRVFAGLLAHYPETRSVRTSFTGRTSAGTIVTWSRTGKKFVCTQDSAPIEDAITGRGTELQTWEHYTDWEDIEMGMFGA